MANTKRELFLLFKPSDLMTVWLNQGIRADIITAGYTLVYKHTFANDEPPYIMVSYWGIATDYTICKEVYPEEGESIAFYLIKTQDSKKYIALMNEQQTEYCDYYVEGILTRNAGEHNHSPKEYADHGCLKYFSRQAKVKRIYKLPEQVITSHFITM
jgi:hypothetical protein